MNLIWNGIHVTPRALSNDALIQTEIHLLFFLSFVSERDARVYKQESSRGE